MDGRLDKCSSRASEQRLDSYHARAGVGNPTLRTRPNSQLASIPDPLGSCVVGLCPEAFKALISKLHGEEEVFLQRAVFNDISFNFDNVNKFILF